VKGFRWCPHCSSPHPLDARVCQSTGRELLAADTPAKSDEGRIIADRYRLKKQIGKGPVALVYEAEELAFGRTVAMKIVRNDNGAQASPAMLRRVRDDARSLSAVAHPNLSPYSDFGELPGGVVYFVSERLRGATLKVDREGAREIDVREIMTELLSGLHAAHVAGVIHGNVKPTNIFLSTRAGCSPAVKLLDFGGYMPRAPRYVSPEELMGGPSDGRSDLWACGVVLYRLLTGTRPYHEKVIPDLIAAFHQGPPTPPSAVRGDLAREWDMVIRRALDRMPGRRFGSALEFLDALPPPEALKPAQVILPSLVSVPPPSGDGFDVMPDSPRAALEAMRLMSGRSMTEPLLGRLIASKYRLESLIGKGSAGAIYKGVHVDLGREVAVKILHPENRDKAEFTRRFKVEARVVSKIDHVNVTRVLDFGEEPDGLLYIVMEYVAGQSLEKIIETQGKLPTARVVKIGIQVCNALMAAHELDIVHRDIKPENLLLVSHQSEDGPVDLVKVCDFGMLKLKLPLPDGEEMTTMRTLNGSPAYMSPEQARCEDLDLRSDIYSLGVTLYEALTGVLPIMGEGIIEHLTRAQHQAPRTPSELLPDLDPLLEDIILKMLEKDPNKRHPSARVVRAELQEVAREVSQPSSANIEIIALSKYPGQSE
jgi:serine/threonine protein kinase